MTKFCCLSLPRSVAIAAVLGMGTWAWLEQPASVPTAPQSLNQVGLPPDDPKQTPKASTEAGAKEVAAKEENKETAAPSNKRKKSVEEEPVYNKLTPFEANVILRRGTERAFTGEYTDLKDPGTYICRRCNAALYQSDSKFESHCGWPSFDDEIKGAVKRRPEIDGSRRIEIICNNCGGHLGHVFLGEGLTQKNTRHCVNSVSMKFVPKGTELPEVIKPKSKEKEKAKAPETTKAPEITKEPVAEEPKAQ